MTREEAIQIIKDYIALDADVKSEYLDALKVVVEALEQPEPHWIPCSERLPEEERKVYLVTYKTLHGRRYVRDLQTNYVGETPRYVGWSKKVKGEVIAWMPLPEPYKGDT